MAEVSLRAAAGHDHLCPRYMKRGLLEMLFKSEAFLWLYPVPPRTGLFCCAVRQINSITHDSLIALVKHEERR